MRHIVAAVIRRGDLILICQRSRSGAMPLRWEFPGGKLEAGESERDALRRELREELGIEARPGRLFARVRHTYPETGALELAFYEVLEFEGEPVAQPRHGDGAPCRASTSGTRGEAALGPAPAKVFEQIVWEHPSRFDTYDFLPADRPLLAMLDSVAKPRHGV